MKEHIDMLHESNNQLQTAVNDLSSAVSDFLKRRRVFTNPATHEVIEANKLAAASFYDFEDRSV
jgi:uncharacterized protein YoxC